MPSGGEEVVWWRGLVTELQACLLVFTLVLLVIKGVQRLLETRHLPPGPWGLPLLGVLPLLGKKPYVTFQKWWAHYGDVYSIRMGSRLVLIVNGLPAMKECYVRQSDVFHGRPWDYFRRIVGNKGIVFSDGENWREHRRFTLSCLRDLGMGKTAIEERVQQEAIYLLNELAAQNNKPFDMQTFLPKAIANNICTVIYGNRFDYNDPVFETNIVKLFESVRGQNMMKLVSFMPWLSFILKLMPRDKKLSHNVEQRARYAQEMIDRHRENFDPENPRDFIDCYLKRMSEQIGKEQQTTMSEDQMARTIQDLFIAGTETVNTTLKWSFLFIALHQDIQERVQKEIEQVIGSSRLPSVRDRLQMPYTEATVMECQRKANIALFSVPRCTTADTKVMGYHIPQGTWVFVNRWGVHASSRYWNQPERFDPTRFLDVNGKVHKPDAFIPFGMGPRSCLGESLAKMELFLFFTSVLQAFHLRLPPGRSVPSLEPQMGINMCPQYYELQAVPR